MLELSVRGESGGERIHDRIEILFVLEQRDHLVPSSTVAVSLATSYRALGEPTRGLTIPESRARARR